MASETRNHWGEWIGGRSLHVGYRRQKDLADAVGCERTQLYKWKKMSEPPFRMHRGLDRRLVIALRTDAFTLFSGYATIDPKHAPIVNPPRRRPPQDGDGRHAQPARGELAVKVA